MIIHNATFMIESNREEAFLSWLRIKLTDLRFEGGTNLRISAMREAGGVDYRQAEAQSVAVQLEFKSIDEAHKWSAGEFSTLAARFEEEFGPHAMVFTSLFEIIK